MKFGVEAHHFSGKFFEIKDWFCSRKYDGESALWNSHTRGILANTFSWSTEREISTGLWSLGRYSQPKIIHAPDFWLDVLPKNIPLHGELWYNDNRSFVASVCRKKYSSCIDWMLIKFIPHNIKPLSLWNDKFFTPSMDFYRSDLPFWKKKNLLEQISSSSIFNMEYTIVNSSQYMNYLIQESIDRKWEGLIFNNPDGLYKLDRSWDILKYKNCYETEVKIIGYEDGKTGKNIGKTGALLCELTWDNKIESIFGGNSSMIGLKVCFCICGLTEEERENLSKYYPIGKEILMSYYGVTNYGIPCHANIYRRK